MPHSRTPVLIGAAQHTLARGALMSPIEMIAQVTHAAARDAGLEPHALTAIDFLGVVGFTVDAPGSVQRLPIPRFANPPAAIAQSLGADPRRAFYTHMGGNTPQAMVNYAAAQIAAGESDFAILTGAEFLGVLMKRLQAGQDVSMFGGGAEGEPERWGDPRDGCTPHEAAHGLDYPVNVYPLFENALRAHRGRDLAAHRAALGALFAPFTQVAAANPHAWFRVARSAEDLVAETDDNRMVGYPYTKYLNAIIQVDQAAALIMTSTAKADQLGVPPSRRVYLHGCADAYEKWNVTERSNFWSAPAIGACGRRALDMAGISLADLSFFDIYSCFPSAVEIACAELGVAEDDPRGLTLTGGLPYFGGPGNNYSMHAIVEAMARCRQAPEAMGLVTANGWFLTKHAMGVYSARPFEGEWRREAPNVIQAGIDAAPAPAFTESPLGPATIETYTVVHGRSAPRMGIVIGRDAAGRRFVANTPEDAATLLDLQAREGVGRPGRVGPHPEGGRNLFTPE